jgi:agmatine/peptidylarginine deiminase
MPQRLEERLAKAPTLDRRHQMAQAALPQTPVKTHQLPKFDKWMRQAGPRPLKTSPIGSVRGFYPHHEW